MRPWLLVALMMLACGGSTPPPASEPSVAPSPAPPANSEPSSPPATEKRVLNETQCEALLEHIFAIAITEQNRGKSVDEQANADEIQSSKEAIRAELLPACVGAAPEAFRYDCAMRASDLPAYRACESH